MVMVVICKERETSTVRPVTGRSLRKLQTFISCKRLYSSCLEWTECLQISRERCNTDTLYRQTLSIEQRYAQLTKSSETCTKVPLARWRTRQIYFLFLVTLRQSHSPSTETRKLQRQIVSLGWATGLPACLLSPDTCSIICNISSCEL